MSTKLLNPAYYHEDDTSQTAVVITSEDTSSQQEAVSSAFVNSEALTEPDAPNIVKPFSVFAKMGIVGIGLFVIGAIIILIYFSTHPVIYQAKGMGNFELKSVLAEDPEPITPQTTTVAPVESNKNTTAAENAESHANSEGLDDYIASIQPKHDEVDKVSATNAEPVIASDNKNHIEAGKAELKTEPATNLTVITSDNAQKTPATPEKIEKTKNDNLLMKLVNGITEHGGKEPVCDNAMRALNQCR